MDQEARSANKRWSEETFKNIFLKIVLKDRKLDINFPISF
jgi:hypothetical protein